MKQLWPATLLALMLSAAHAQTEVDVEKFIAIAKSRVKSAEAADALRAGPAEEFARWGKETCNWVRIGKATFPEVTENLAEFFGDDLAQALVFSARKVICPELTDKKSSMAPEPASGRSN